MAKPKFTPAEIAVLTDPYGREMSLPAVAGSLRPKQILFARYAAMGLAFSAAVRAAGYEPSTPESCKAMGSELAANPKIAELIRLFTASLLKSTAPVALAALTKILSDPKAKDADKIKAAMGVLNKSQPTRTAHQIEADVQHTHRVEAPPAEHRLAALYIEAGLPVPANLQIAAPIVTDAEFEEVVPERLQHVHGHDTDEDPSGPATAAADPNSFGPDGNYW